MTAAEPAPVTAMQPDHERTARRIERRVVRFVEERSLFGGGEPVLLAVSGGPDSLALLHIVSRTRARWGITPVVAYVDHGLRPADQIAAERAFVEAEAGRLGVGFVAGATPAEQSGGRRRSPEDAARRGRYTVLAGLAAAVGAAAVATGHTRTDQAETVLLRLIGGAGLRGLAAMAPVAGWPVPAEAAPRLVRPLLCLSRRETVEYCAALGLAPRSDPENRNPRYLRNRLRTDVLPALVSLNPRIEFVLADLAEEAQAWRAAVEATLPHSAHAVDESGVETWSLEVGLLRSMEQPLRRMTLRAALATARRCRSLPGSSRSVSRRSRDWWWACDVPATGSSSPA
jgi:tRNA(Ile)-lysidine synthetase-like protein